MTKKVPTNTYKVVCWTHNMSVPFSKKADANALKDAHNNVAHKGRVVAHVQEIVV